MKELAGLFAIWIGCLMIVPGSVIVAYTDLHDGLLIGYDDGEKDSVSDSDATLIVGGMMFTFGMCLMLIGTLRYSIFKDKYTEDEEDD